jgi:hypothetical protein
MKELYFCKRFSVCCCIVPAEATLIVCADGFCCAFAYIKTKDGVMLHERSADACQRAEAKKQVSSFFAGFMG